MNIKSINVDSAKKVVKSWEQQVARVNKTGSAFDVENANLRLELAKSRLKFEISC